MSVAKDTHLEVVQEETVMSKEEVVYSLVALGVNSCYRSYDSAHKQLKEEFLDLPLRDISKSWKLLDSNVKIMVIEKYHESFMKWTEEG